MGKSRRGNSQISTTKRLERPQKATNVHNVRFSYLKKQLYKLYSTLEEIQCITVKVYNQEVVPPWMKYRGFTTRRQPLVTLNVYKSHTIMQRILWTDKTKINLWWRRRETAYDLMNNIMTHIDDVTADRNSREVWSIQGCSNSVHNIACFY